MITWQNEVVVDVPPASLVDEAPVYARPMREPGDLILLQAMPGIGKVRAMQIMDRLKISESRRLRGLGNQQRRALLAEFTPNGR